MKASRFISVTLMLLGSVPALADEHASDATSEETDDKVCINTNLVRNFDALSDEHVYIEERARQGYLLTMRNKCSGLRFAKVIGFKDTTSRMCSKGFGEIVHGESGIGRLSCRVDTIEPVESKDEARAIVDEHAQWKKERKQAEKAEKKMKKAEKAAAEE